MKNTRQHIFLYLIVGLLAFFVTSCYEDDSCNENTVTGINMSVFSSGSDADADPDTLDVTAGIQWAILPPSADTVLVSSSDLSSSVGLHLDANADMMTVLFIIRNEDSPVFYVDTVVFEYVQTELEQLSNNCGFAPVYTIYGGSNTTHALDSVVLEDPLVNTDITDDNVTFYY